MFYFCSNRNFPNIFQGYVTDVTHQGGCGSCWAYSAVGALEGAHYKSTGELVSLSVQQLVDCSLPTMGCRGGWYQKAFRSANWTFQCIYERYGQFLA